MNTQTLECKPKDCPEHVKEWIACCAIRARDGSIFVLEQPSHHGEIVRFMINNHGKSVLDTGPDHQGFYTNTKRFVNRYEARTIALSASQIRGEAWHSLSDQLYASDLWT